MAIARMGSGFLAAGAPAAGIGWASAARSTSAASRWNVVEPTARAGFRPWGTAWLRLGNLIVDVAYSLGRRAPRLAELDQPALVDRRAARVPGQQLEEVDPVGELLALGVAPVPRPL